MRRPCHGYRVPFMLAYSLFNLAIALSAAGCLRSFYRAQHHRFAVFKTLTMLLIIALALYRTNGGSEMNSGLWAALCLSLLGDIFLLYPARYFFAGLLSFMAAHLAYGALFWSSDTTTSRPWLALCVMLAALIYGRLLYLRAGRLRYAVVVYVAVIAGMLTLALGYGLGLHKPAAVAGALLFALSDGLLGWNKFLRPFHRAQFFILSTYFAAQTLLVYALS